MNGVHAMLVHFPLAFWALATLMILAGVFLSGRFAELSRAGLLPVLVFSLLGAVAGLVSGWLVWPAEANLYSPLARNHILMAIWSLAIYSSITLLIWRFGALMFQGTQRWALVVLALAGGLLFAITGTLGGHLAGSPTHFSQLLAAFGWTVYETFYVPDAVLVALLLLAIIAAGVGLTAKTGDKG
ncbi:DUF2231 domain-containing protein [Marinospirillum alkaliphilum]|uniref:DUF2231 domain-containing protein n=1 Tax=Marinospirillum alkaliphilum DSM 21637 TaxID=1122209 RepID=A0A1K1ZKB0_9GAMM|nr:DUF2231 domain-containing protein [Marinospirillum alkaliphilum]SFX74574.1 hypothetical protein SAMN02745752_02726 [Marinospirillum alkaliphilum DSM 21637]